MMGTADEIETRFGAVALLDALGFKGIWKRFPPKQILHTLATIQREVEGLKEEESYMGVALKLEAHFFSDTIAISASVPDGDQVDADTCGALLSRVAAGAGLAQAVAVCFEPLLAYRGCIALGKLATHGSFVIGEAVDEAAQYMEQANAAVVWLSPQAAKRYVEQESLGRGQQAAIVNYDVPLRNGSSLATLAVNPITQARRLSNLPRPENRRAFVDMILASFDAPERVGTQPPVEVMVKKQNTAAFLNHALHVVDAIIHFEVEQFRRAMSPEQFEEMMKGGDW